MAMFPCSIGPHAHGGSNSNYYVALGAHGVFTRWRTRLCRIHSAAIEQHLAEFEILPEDTTAGFYGPKSQCFTCHEPISEGGQELFVTGYPSQNERKDYWARVHLTCGLPDALSDGVGVKRL